jgi:hypothetical protein
MVESYTHHLLPNELTIGMPLINWIFSPLPRCDFAIILMDTVLGHSELTDQEFALPQHVGALNQRLLTTFPRNN